MRRQLHRHARRREGVPDGLRPRRHAPIELSDDNTPWTAGVGDHSGGRDRCENIARPPKDVAAANPLAQAFDVLHPVLQCQHGGLAAQQRSQQLGGCVSVVGFHRKQGQVDGSDLFRPVRGPDPHLQRFGQANGLQPQPTVPHGGQVGSPGQERDVVPGPLEQGAVVAANAARPDHGNFHARILPNSVCAVFARRDRRFLAMSASG